MSADEAIRDARGRLLPGTPSLNPNGRPRRAVEESTLKVLGEEWGEDAIRRVARMVLTFAEAGNISAAITILHYMAGKPMERLDVTSDGASVKGYTTVSPDMWPGNEDTQPTFPIPPDIAALDDVIDVDVIDHDTDPSHV